MQRHIDQLGAYWVIQLLGWLWLSRTLITVNAVPILRHFRTVPWLKQWYFWAEIRLQISTLLTKYIIILVNQVFGPSLSQEALVSFLHISKGRSSTKWQIYPMISLDFTSYRLSRTNRRDAFGVFSIVTERKMN